MGDHMHMDHSGHHGHHMAHNEALGDHQHHQMNTTQDLTELIINNTPEAFREHEEHSLGHELHGMESMTFHGGYTETILFSWWTVADIGVFIGSFLAIFIMALLYEGLKYYRKHLLWKTYTGLQYCAVAPPDKGVTNICTADEPQVIQSMPHVLERNIPTMMSSAHAWQTVLHGSAAVALLNPYRGDMIACLGEITGESSLKYMRGKMLETTEGAKILTEQPRINSQTVCFETLSKMPERSIGRVYADFMTDNNITADSRLPVQFISDPELAYVMQRYREVHDLVHAILFMKTTMLGEVTVKWIEGIQTKLPMCIGGGIWGAARLKPKHRQLYLKHYLPWAITIGNNSKFLQGIYFEKRWDQDIEDFHKEMNITRLNIK